MEITVQRTVPEEAEMMVETYNKAFYEDYVRYGICPGYGHSLEYMRKSIDNSLHYTILHENRMIGAMAVGKLENGQYHIGCLCIIPEYQGKGIGTDAVAFLQKELTDWKTFSLETPLDKIQNVKFYTEKCGFDIIDRIKDGDVELFVFKKDR